MNFHTFGHSNKKMRVSAHKIGVFMGTISCFFFCMPKRCEFRIYYRLISSLLGIKVDFYELVPNMVIMDKWKQIFCY